MIWHIVKKDLRLLWPYVAASAALQILVGISFAMLDPWSGGASHPPLAFTVVASLARLGSMLLLIVLAVQQDPIPGERQDWIARPIAPRDLLAAKLLFVLLTVQVPGLVESLIAGALHPAMYNPAGALVAVLYSFVGFSLPVMMVAALTRNIREAGIVLVLIVAAQYGVLAGSGGQIYGLSHMATGWIAAAAQSGIILIAGLTILPLQYFKRKTYTSAAIFVALFALYLAAPFFPHSMAFAIQSRLSPQPEAAAPIAISFDASMGKYTYEGVESDVFVYVPIRISGLAKGSILMAEGMTLRLTDADGRELYSETPAFSFFHEANRDGDLWLEWRQDQAGDVHTRHVFHIPLDVYTRVRNIPLRVEIDYSLILLRKDVGGSIALPNGKADIPGLGSCTGQRSSGYDNEIEILCTDPRAATHCLTYFVENTATGKRNPLEERCTPELAPRGLGSSLIAPTTDTIVYGFHDISDAVDYPVDISQLAQTRMALTTYRSQAYFTRGISSPLLRLDDLRGVRTVRRPR